MTLELGKLINTCVWWEFDWDLALFCVFFVCSFRLVLMLLPTDRLWLLLWIFGRPRFAEPLTNITVEIDISVSGAALGGLQRYVSIQGLTLKEGGQVPITAQNINFSAVTDFISMHHRGKLCTLYPPLSKKITKHNMLPASFIPTQSSMSIPSPSLSSFPFLIFHDAFPTFCVIFFSIFLLWNDAAAR